MCETVMKLLKSSKQMVSNESIGGQKNPEISKRTPTAIRDSRVTICNQKLIAA